MSARDYALLELDRRHLPGWASGLLKRGPAPLPGDGRDLALGEQLLTGVIKNLLHLRYLLEHYSGRRLRDIEPVVQKIAVIGLYQLRFLGRVPASAAVDQAVEQAKRWHKARAAGFVNVVLRRAAREPMPAIPAAQDDPAAHARLALSHPPELFARLQKLLGTADAIRFCAHDNQEPPTIVRLIGAAPEQLQGPGVAVRPHSQPGMYVVSGARRPLLAQWANQGIAQVQDPTAALVAPRLRIEPGQNVLDRCCGMGTKTLHMRDFLGESGRITAMDVSESRCQALHQLLSRRGIGNVEVHQGGKMADLRGRAPGPFDRALLDVPCSNSGVLARRAEARYRQTPAALSALIKLQTDLLADTAPSVRPGGLLLYSTCSIWPEENEQRIGQFLRSRPDWHKLVEETTMPSMADVEVEYHDGGYSALLARIGSITN